MITQSRYFQSSVSITTEMDGRTRPFVNVIRRPVADPVNYTYYHWSDNDRIDWLADKRYGDPRLWWVVADANPDVIDWANVRPGTILKVPSGVPQR